MEVLIVILVFNLIAAEEPPQQFPETKNEMALESLLQSNMITKHNGNVPYVERDENLLRMPVFKQNGEKRTNKKPKKNPKRTIQKIIKKNRMKSKYRRMYVRVTEKSTDQTENYESYEEPTNTRSKITTQATQKRKPKKWSSKLPRYHMPFQSLQLKKDKRFKRKVTRDIKLNKFRPNSLTEFMSREHLGKRDVVSREIYISKDFNEIELLPKFDGYEMNTHVMRPW